MEDTSDQGPDQISRGTEKGQKKSKENQRRDTALVWKNIAAQGRDAVQDDFHIDKLQQETGDEGRVFSRAVISADRLSFENGKRQIQDISCAYVFQIGNHSGQQPAKPYARLHTEA